MENPNFETNVCNAIKEEEEEDQAKTSNKRKQRETKMPKAVQNENDASLDLSLENLFGVKGKVAVVTGGGSGIGHMISLGLVQNGATVYIVSRKDTSETAREIERTSKAGGKCISIQGDLGTDEGVQAFAEKIQTLEPNGINILVNNSGTNWGAPIETYEPKAWDKVYALNVKGVFNLTRLLIGSLEKGVEKAKSPSRVINVASIDGLRVPALETYAYSSGKAAISHLTRVLAGKLGERNITVNAIAPGPFPSRMMRATLERAGDAIANSTAIGRVGKPQDMASAVLYLCGEGGSFVTGAEIVVDGGTIVKPKI